MRFRRISFPISAVLSIAAIVLFFFNGLNLGVDFVGGTLIEVQSKAGPADISKMRATVGALNLGEAQLQQFGAATDVLIRIPQQPGGELAQQEAAQKVRAALGNEIEIRRIEVVGPRVSTELLAYGIFGLLVAIVGIFIYLWFRFEWQFALGAMISNVHDLVLTIGFLSLMQIDFDLNGIAALMTILGYSLNDTVVIYDRIREMLRRYKKMPIEDLLNVSINSTLSRSVITHVTVTLALLALFFFGGHAIHSFTATMLFGVVLVGTYTSIFIAAPMLIYLGVGLGRQEADEPTSAKFEPEAPSKAAAKSATAKLRIRRLRLASHRRRSPPPPSAELDGPSRTPHFPRPAQIEFMDAVVSVLRGCSHRGSLLLLPSGVWGWPVTEPAGITAEALAPVITDADRIGLLLIGTGATRWPLPVELMQLFASHGISAETSRTGQAANTYNMLLDEGRRVAAALIAVD